MTSRRKGVDFTDRSAIAALAALSLLRTEAGLPRSPYCCTTSCSNSLLCLLQQPCTEGQPQDWICVATPPVPDKLKPVWSNQACKHQVLTYPHSTIEGYST